LEPLPANDVLAVLSEIFCVEAKEFSLRSRNSALRAIAARFLIRYSGLTQRDTASILKVGIGAGVCNQFARLPAKLSGDRRLSKQFQQAEDKLRTLRASHREKA
jgi:hypothetical protein